MVIVMREDCPKGEVGEVLAAISQRGLEPRIIAPAPKVVIGIVEEMDGALIEELKDLISSMDGVKGIETFGTSWKLVSRNFREEGTTISIGRQVIGGGDVAVIAGPCAVESRDGIIEIAKHVNEAASGANLVSKGIGEEIATSANEVAKNIAEAANGITEFNKKIAENSVITNEANSCMQQANSSSLSVKERMQEMMIAVDRVCDAIKLLEAMYQGED